LSKLNVTPVRSAGLAILLAMAGCAAIERAPTGDPAAGGAPQAAPAAVKPAAAVVAPEAGAAVKPPETPAAEVKAATVEPVAAPAKADVDAVKRPAKESAEAAPKKETAAPAKPPVPPPLDLNALEKRLKDTEAIGVFTKLTLKNQVSDLLERFEVHHGGANKATLAELRQPYDLLILKVLSLLQDRDTTLAKDILASREAIWGILSDPAKFQSLVNQNRS
jgi:hypothetical protein